MIGLWYDRSVGVPLGKIGVLAALLDTITQPPVRGEFFFLPPCLFVMLVSLCVVHASAYASVLMHAYMIVFVCS